MRKFQTCAGPKSVDEIVAELVPTGPQGTTGFPCSPPGANGPAGSPFLPSQTVRVPTGPASSPNLPLKRDRAEVDLRQAIRRCFSEGVPLDRMVEIFRLELVDVVHDD